ncbi:Nudix hydrolase 24, chloroplastic [Nymphon striatum]|nr:Nudix hydrolase 24, chloroplastic [Nymphon striatum]
MSYLDHIIGCNSFVEDEYLPFRVDDEHLGWMQKTFAPHVLSWEEVFHQDETSVFFNPDLNSPEKRTEACKPIIENLHKDGVIDSWVGEPYAITQTFGETPRFLIERAAVSFFGVRGYGVHINGLVKKTDGDYIWIARRTWDKPFWPGKLDQMVAGGQPAGIGLMENVIKESAEEANIPESFSSQSELVSEIHYRGATKRGMHVDSLFNYDLWLPEDFVPENTDGEVDEFFLMPLEEMARITETTDEFKDNCNLVNIDLLLRLGMITKSHPDYEEIVKRLYAPATL